MALPEADGKAWAVGAVAGGAEAPLSSPPPPQPASASAAAASTAAAVWRGGGVTPETVGTAT
ncbi:MAG: hypothetical protein E6G30_09390 [Actinobacteria bacterium]|nr:MAG: hypothetical protein E6G30_09390 [Actinomycetota bacterium]